MKDESTLREALGLALSMSLPILALGVVLLMASWAK